MRKSFISAIIALMAINLGLYAQEKEPLDTLGVLRGNIRSQSGKPIGNATIKIIGTDYTSYSGPSGYFRFNGLPAKMKKVQIEVSKDGYYTDTEKVFVTEQKYQDQKILSYDIMLLSKSKKDYMRSCWAKIGFSWRKNPEPDLAGYKIYRANKPIKENPQFELIKIITCPDENIFIDSAPLIGDNYYAVTALDTHGLESPGSYQIYFYIAPCRYGQYTVVEGDQLSTIAAKHNVYNDPSKWKWIYEANRENIKDPNLIYPGMILLIPTFDHYKVVSGDCLALIASHLSVYSDAIRWTEIYEANKDIITDPDLIYPNQVLFIPPE